jgi:heterodisulfide reductase subunit C
MVGGHAIVTFLADPEASDYSVWLCSSCWRCTEACPSGVDIHRLMMEERRREPAPVWYRESFERVLATGLALEVSQSSLDALRADRGLEDVRLAPQGVASRLLRPEEC